METAAVTAGFMAFLTEMVAPLLLCSSIPLGSPPVQDPALGRVAPQQCVFYLGWAGIGTPDAKSANSAEKFLADPEIRHMRAEATRRFGLLLKSLAASANEAHAGPLGAIGPFGIPAEFSDDAAVWCDLLVTQPCACFISRVTEGEESPQANGAFVMNVGDAGPKVAAMLKHYRELGKSMIEESTVDGHIEYRLKLGDPPAASDAKTLKENVDAVKGELDKQGNKPGKGQTIQFKAIDAKPKAAPAATPADKTHAVAANAVPQPPEAQADDPHLRWGLRGKYLIVTLGDESPSEIVKRMKGPEPEWFTTVGKDLPIERRAAIVRVDLEALAAPFDKGPPSASEFAQQIRDTHLHAVTLVTGLGHDDFVSQLLVEPDRVAAVLMKTMIDRPLKAEDLAVIPRDATLAMAFRLNPSLIAAGMRWLDQQGKESNAESNKEPAEKSEGGDSTDNTIDLSQAIMSPYTAVEKAMSRFGSKTKGTLDNQLCDELAASIDDTWRLYTSPGEGSSIFNGMTGVVRVKDGQRLTKLFDQLATRKPAVKVDAKTPFATPKGAEPKPETWAVRKSRFAEHDVYYLVRASGESAGVLTWCLVKNELVCSLSPANVKAYLLRQAGGSSLADEPAVVAAFRDKQSPTLLMYEDSREMFRLTYPLMQSWAMMMAGQGGLPTDGIDPMLLPASPTIAKYLRPAVSTASIVPKGVQLTLHQSLPNGNLGATLYCVMCSLLPANADSLATTAGIPAPGPSDAADSTKKTHDFVLSSDTPPTAAASAAPKAKGNIEGTTGLGALKSGPIAANPSSAPAADPYAPPGPLSANTATAAPCVPGPAYPSTSTPEPYSPPRRADLSRAPLWTPAVANAPTGYSTAPPAYVAPRPNAPAAYPIATPPSAPTANAQVVYVPMVIYVPMVYGTAGNPPAAYSPVVYPPPGYAAPTYAPPASAPSGYSAPAYRPGASTPPTYTPPGPPPATYTPAPSGYASAPATYPASPNGAYSAPTAASGNFGYASVPAVAPPAASAASAGSPVLRSPSASQPLDPALQAAFSVLMNRVHKAIDEGKVAEAQLALKTLLANPDLPAEQATQITALLAQLDGRVAPPSYAPLPVVLSPGNNGPYSQGAIPPPIRAGTYTPAAVYARSYAPAAPAAFYHSSYTPAAAAACPPATLQFYSVVGGVPSAGGSSSAAGSARFTEKGGVCKIKKGSAFDKDVFTVEIGQDIHGICKFYLDDFFGGKTVLNANMSVKNTSKKQRTCYYFVAFFDKADRLVGCASQGLPDSGLAPGESTNMASCLVFLPDGMSETVASYKVRLYETDKMPEKKK